LIKKLEKQTRNSKVMKPTESKHKHSVTVRGHELKIKPSLFRSPAILALLLCAAVVCAALPAAAQTLTVTKGGVSVSSVCVGDTVHIMLNLEGSSCDMLPTLTEAYLSNSVSATSGSDVPIWLAYDGEAGWEGDYTTTSDDVGYDILYTSDGDPDVCPISPVLLTVVDVDGLTPTIPSGQGGLEAGSSPPQYWVAPCASGSVTVTATSKPSLAANQLPSGWTFTGGVETDKLNHTAHEADVLNGSINFTVTCGTSANTIVLEQDPIKPNYSAATPSPPGTCYSVNYSDPAPFTDLCGNNLAINCVGCSPTTAGHFEYRYNTPSGPVVGICYFGGGNNSFLFMTTKHNSRILRTWHLTEQDGIWWDYVNPNARWVVTRYNCLATGAQQSYNYRYASAWNSAWGRPADEIVPSNPGYPANSCEFQGYPVTWE
jgi:hypothetical protein